MALESLSRRRGRLERICPPRGRAGRAGTSQTEEEEDQSSQGVGEELVRVVGNWSGAPPQYQEGGRVTWV